MLDLNQLPLFMVALVAVYVVPGPDMALILSSSAAQGARIGIRTALGVACARFLHAILSGMGLAALMVRYPMFAMVIRYAGAGYLAWLAWGILRSKGSATLIEQTDASTAFRRGFLTNLLNPKAVIFCGMFLPQFVHGENGPLWAQFVALGAIFVMTGLCFDVFYAFTADRVARKVGGGKSGKWQRWIVGTVFGGLAVHLIAG
ncbi:LysE family translocator [Burkholderiaceae bacterium DAT-1]|nr:LysE family translocator [Burkholderiaceae bacterium DAT-1]